jgi:hypothetical protein
MRLRLGWISRFVFPRLVLSGFARRGVLILFAVGEGAVIVVIPMDPVLIMFRQIFGFVPFASVERQREAGGEKANGKSFHEGAEISV